MIILVLQARHSLASGLSQASRAILWDLKTVVTRIGRFWLSAATPAGLTHVGRVNFGVGSAGQLQRKRWSQRQAEAPLTFDNYTRQTLAQVGGAA